MAARLSAPVLGAPGQYKGPDKWDVAFSWRYQKSDRHFVGHEEQVNRATEHSEVINRVHQPELSIKRNFNSRWSLTVGIPYLMATRSSGLRRATTDPEYIDPGQVIARTEVQSRGIGDITVTPFAWIWDPLKVTRGNIGIGLGVKIPTGANNVNDTRQTAVYNVATGVYTFPNSIRTNDQSIQPGDGGFGEILDMVSYIRWGDDKWAGYVTGTYLFNPGNKSGVATYRSAPGEEFMSISDAFQARAGVAWYPGKGWGVSLGERIEGVPTYDLIGESDGFRRPGYSIAIEPGVTWTHGARMFSFSLPIAIDRNRKMSVADHANGTHGDAAFADYVWLLGYVQRF